METEAKITGTDIQEQDGLEESFEPLSIYLYGFPVAKDLITRRPIKCALELLNMDRMKLGRYLVIPTGSNSLAETWEKDLYLDEELRKRKP